MSKNMPVGSVKYVENASQFSKDFIKNCHEDSDEVYVQYPEKLHDLQNHLAFFHEIMKIGKVEIFVANSHDIKEYVIHIANLKQA